MNYRKIFADKNVKFDFLIKEYTNFKVGGVCDVVAFPKSPEEVIDLLKVAKENNIPTTVLGNLTNLIVRDGGIEGLVILLRENYAVIKVEGDEVTALAGATLQKTANIARDNSLAGMEFAHGIPGSVGGGITMNAGAYDGELKDIVKSVTAITKDFEIREFSNEEMKFRYRNSLVQDENLVVLSATFKLKCGNKEEINDKMCDLMARRKAKQPLEYPSAGSTFKRPEGYFAGKLIQDAGLKGLTHGGAQISKKHSGFVINIGGATAKDIVELIETVQKIIHDKFGVEIEREVKIIGRE